MVVKVNSLPILNLRHADDAVLIANDAEDLQRCNERNQVSEELELNINTNYS